MTVQTQKVKERGSMISFSDVRAITFRVLTKKIKGEISTLF